MKPSELLKQALRGEPTDDPATLSWLRLFVYKKACAVLDLPKENRLNAIEGDPLSEAVKQEVLRLHKYREGIK